jgi:hypothetical protein
VSEASSSGGEFKAAHEEYGFSQLELAQRTRHATWCPANRPDGGPLAVGAQPNSGDWDAPYGHGSTRRAEGRRLSGSGVHFYTNPSPRANSFALIRQVCRRSCRL